MPWVMMKIEAFKSSFNDYGFDVSHFCNFPLFINMLLTCVFAFAESTIHRILCSIREFIVVTPMQPWLFQLAPTTTPWSWRRDKLKRLSLSNKDANSRQELSR